MPSPTVCTNMDVCNKSQTMSSTLHHTFLQKYILKYSIPVTSSIKSHCIVIQLKTSLQQVPTCLHPTHHPTYTSNLATNQVPSTTAYVKLHSTLTSLLETQVLKSQVLKSFGHWAILRSALVHSSAECTCPELSVHYPSSIFVSWALTLHHSQVQNHLEIKYNIQVPMFTVCTKNHCLHSLECQVPLYIRDPTATFFIKHQFPILTSPSFSIKFLFLVLQRGFFSSPCIYQCKCLWSQVPSTKQLSPKSILKSTNFSSTQVPFTFRPLHEVGCTSWVVYQVPRYTTAVCPDHARLTTFRSIHYIKSSIQVPLEFQVPTQVKYHCLYHVQGSQYAPSTPRPTLNTWFFIHSHRYHFVPLLQPYSSPASYF